jgi:hypothetical protein
MPIKDALKERLKHPILGGYVIAFLLVNYDLTLSLLSMMTVSEKIEMINNLSYVAYLWPFFATIAYYAILFIASWCAGFLDEALSMATFRGRDFAQKGKGLPVTDRGKAIRYDSIRDHVKGLIDFKGEIVVHLDARIERKNETLLLSKEIIRLLKHYPKNTDASAEEVAMITEKFFEGFQGLKIKYRDNPLYVTNLGDIDIVKK